MLVVPEQLRRAVPGGIGTYAAGLLGGLRDLDGQRPLPAIGVYASRRPGGAGAGPDPLESFGFPVTTSRLPGLALTRAWDRGLVHAPARGGVVHAVSLAAPPVRAAHLVGTVHDLLWRSTPDAFPPRGRHWHEAALRRLLRRAAGFVVPSAVVAQELVAAGAPPDGVHIVEPGCDHLPAPDHRGAERVLATLGVGGPFLLSVGTIEPRKNLQRVVAAYRAALPQLPERWPLVVVGPVGWAAGGGFAATEGVVAVGRVDPGVLAALYASARVLAYVPLAEGYGLPPVEAMRAGAPVVSSRALPSVQGAALEVDPRDVAGIAEALVVGAVDGPERRRLVEVGTARVKGLTWKVAAEGHLAVWEALG